MIAKATASTIIIASTGMRYMVGKKLPMIIMPQSRKLLKMSRIEITMPRILKTCLVLEACVGRLKACLTDAGVFADCESAEASVVLATFGGIGSLNL